MTFDDIKRFSLGKQGLTVDALFDSFQRERYLNYLIQAIQSECEDEILHNITVEMAKKLTLIIKDDVWLARYVFDYKGGD